MQQERANRPRENQQSPSTFTEGTNDNTRDEKPKGKPADNFQIPGDGTNPCGLPPLLNHE
jgi:hypothetical protein